MLRRVAYFWSATDPDRVKISSIAVRLTEAHAREAAGGGAKPTTEQAGVTKNDHPIRCIWRTTRLHKQEGRSRSVSSGLSFLLPHTLRLVS